jgi:hypothetical protein
MRLKNGKEELTNGAAIVVAPIDMRLVSKHLMLTKAEIEVSRLDGDDTVLSAKKSESCSHDVDLLWLRVHMV